MTTVLRFTALCFTVLPLVFLTASSRPLRGLALANVIGGEQNRQQSAGHSWVTHSGTAGTQEFPGRLSAFLSF
jgi:hypothetical protein